MQPASKSAAWSARHQAESPLLPSPIVTTFPSEDGESLMAMLSGNGISSSGGGAAAVSTQSLSSLATRGFTTPPMLAPLQPASPTTVSGGGVGMAGATTAAPAVWKTGLYERQPFEDNYVDPVLFLQKLKKNTNVKVYHYADIVKDTFVIVQQISFIVVFVYMFALIVSGRVALATVFAIDGVVLLCGAVSFLALRQELDPTPLPLMSIFHFGQQAALFCSVVVLLSPVFQTLTVSYTDDTIWALGITAMFVHLLFSDYAYLNAVETKYVQGVGINAATFGAILMASRIQSPLFGAALIGFGILCFNLSPIPRHFLKSYSPMVHVGATFLLCGVTMGCLLQVPLLAALFAFCVVCICFVLPWCFVTLQARYKNQISGPWDEAKPQNSLAAAEWANAGLLS